MKYFLAALLSMLLPGMASAQTAVQFGAVRTNSPWNICVYDSANVCQNFLTLPSTGGGALVPAANGGLGANESSAIGVVQFLSGTATVSQVLANGTTATTQTSGDNSTKVATTAFVAGATGAFLPLAGGTMIGTITGADGGTWGSSGINGSIIGAASTLASGVPFSGYLLGTNIAAPSTPASGHAAIYVDSTQKILGVKNDTGAISLSVFPSSASTHQFGTGLTSNGQLTFAQPAVGDISGWGTGVATSLGTAVDTAGGISIYGTAATTVNGQSCVIGLTCTVTAAASSFTPGTTTVVGATSPCVLVNSATTVSGCIDLTNSYLASGSFTNITGVGALTAGTWNATTIAVAHGGTGGVTASGTLLDNITGFSSTGILDRTGSGTYSFTTPGTGVLAALAQTTNTASGIVIPSGIGSGTCANGIGLTSGNVPILDACPGIATAITALTTTTSGVSTGHFLGSVTAGCTGTTPCLADTGIATPTNPPSQQAYPNGAASCLNSGVCSAGTGIANGQSFPFMNGNTQFIEPGVIGQIQTINNPIANGWGGTLTCSGGSGGSGCGGNVFDLNFTAGFTGAPQSVSYTGLSTDTPQSATTALCALIIANTVLSPTSGLVFVCQPTGPVGGFNLQWSTNITPTITTTGTTGGSIAFTTAGAQNLDAVFWYFNRYISGYSAQAGDGVECFIFNLNSSPLAQDCKHISAISGGITSFTSLDSLLTGNQVISLEYGNGVVVPSASNTPAFEGLGTIDLALQSGGGLWFGGDANMYEGTTNRVFLKLGSANSYEIVNNAGSTNLMDYGTNTAGAWTISVPLYLAGLNTGSGTAALCLTSGQQVESDTSATICGISALRYKNLISEITPEQGLAGILSLRGEAYRYKADIPGEDGGKNIHVSLIADDMAAMNPACAEYSNKGVENYMDRCFEAYQTSATKELWEIISDLVKKLPANDPIRKRVDVLHIRESGR